MIVSTGRATVPIFSQDYKVCRAKGKVGMSTADRRPHFKFSQGAMQVPLTYLPEPCSALLSGGAFGAEGSCYLPSTVSG